MRSVSINAMVLLALLIGGIANHVADAQVAPELKSKADRVSNGQFLSQYCVQCHNAESPAGGLSLDPTRAEDISSAPAIWERVARKLGSRQMPPLGETRPPEDVYRSILDDLERRLDAAALAHPNPGRTESFRRLNRTEYGNAIRDLLDIQVDVTSLLPLDEASHGFDNVALGGLSPTLLDRLLTAAQKISRLAIGGTAGAPGGETIRMRADLTQEEHVEGLPLGTRGGTKFHYNFPRSGEYEFHVRLARDRNEHVEGLNEPHELQILLDRRNMKSLVVQPPTGRQDHETVDAHLWARFHVDAGPHDVGVTFVKNPSSLLETKRQPYQAHFNMHRHPRLSPAVFQVSITGPYQALGAQATPSRRRILVREPVSPDQEEACARQILSSLIQRAYRRPTTESELEVPLKLFRESRAEGDFDFAIESALSAVLVNPNFLFRVEEDPPGVAPGTAYRISDLALASRLSFFLWSSIPDDELLGLAIAGELHRPEMLERQVRRLLADARSENLVTNFADQWLYLRNLDSLTPDLRLFPDFDDNLRQAFRRETELLVEHVWREDRPVLELLRANYTFLNERLAKHYDIPHIYGERFRRVELDQDSVRGGLLRHGSIQTITSYATRTSPVIRGQWILKNLIGTPPPPPPENVPALKDNTVNANLSIRARLAEHRANAACAHCHQLMDPVGFSLENYDAVGRWRSFESGDAVDPSGGLPDGSQFSGVTGLERAILARPELFVRTLTEKLLTFALGRGIEHYDAPAIRKIVRESKAQDYRFSSLIIGIVNSVLFQMRKTE